MRYLFKVDGRLPGMNEYTAAQRTNRYKGAKMKQEAQGRCEDAITQHLPGLRIEKPVRLEFCFYEPNKMRDHDNVSGFAHKVIQDALVQCGVLKDDGWDEICGYSDSFAVSKSNPRIEVTITEVEE